MVCNIILTVHTSSISIKISFFLLTSYPTREITSGPFGNKTLSSDFCAAGFEPRPSDML